jgi:hypothetical protein
MSFDIVMEGRWGVVVVVLLVHVKMICLCLTCYHLVFSDQLLETWDKSLRPQILCNDVLMWDKHEIDCRFGLIIWDYINCLFQ